MTFFVIFSKKVSENLNFFLSKFEIPASVMGAFRVLSESQGLRILPPNMIDPILVVFDI